MKLVASAAVRRGKKTNRLTVKRKAASSGTAIARWRKDPSTRGLDMAIVCISLPVGELVAMDAFCERVRMARSHMLRVAAREFMERNA